MDPTAVRRYSRALFLSAQNRDELERVEQDLLKVRGLIDQYPEISHLVLNSTLSQTEKEDFIEKILPEATSLLVLNFLKVLIKKRRFRELPWMQEEFHRLYEKNQGIQEVKVLSAIPLSPANREKLQEVLRQKFQCAIRLMAETDPAILGGLVLRFDGTEINGSYKNRLDEIRQRLTM